MTQSPKKKGLPKKASLSLYNLLPNTLMFSKKGLLYVGASTSLPLLFLIDQVSSERVCSFAKMNLSSANRSVKVQVTIPKTTVHAYGICVTEK
jgi:hypothetical protein